MIPSIQRLLSPLWHSKAPGYGCYSTNSVYNSLGGRLLFRAASLLAFALCGLHAGAHLLLLQRERAAGSREAGAEEEPEPREQLLSGPKP